MLKSVATPYYPIQDNEKPKLLYTSANFLGIPTNRGQPKIGTYQGPELIRKSNFFQLVAEDGIQLIDRGDVTPVELSETEDPQRFGMKWSRSFSLTTLKIAERVEELMKQSNKHKTESNESKSTPLVIVGGDHSMATGTILGHAKAKPDLCVLWIDAHGDINTPLNSASGNIHGMPLSFLVKELQDQIPWLDDFEGIKPCLNASNIAYIGLRDLDAYETHDIRKHGIAYFTMLDVDRMGIEAVIKEALQAVNPRLEKAIHLSFDIDALDPLVAPSTGTAVPGGLTLREGLRICEEVSATGKLSVVELAELNPLLGSEEDVLKTQSSAIQILRACLGHCRSGHLPFNVRNLTDQEKTFLSVNLININTHNVIEKYERRFSGHENLISNIDYATFIIEKQKNVIVNSKRHLGSIDTKLFDEQGFILKKKFNMNNLILFPFETDNPYEDDRILAQMSYVPVQVLEARKNGRIRMKRIYYPSKSSNSFPDLSHCPVYECSVSDTIQQADLVVLENGAELSISTKQKNQSWLIYHLESPRHFSFPTSKNFINFTATYAVDSTIVTPYYKYVQFSDIEPKDLNNSIQSDKDFSIGKTKMIAWFVSNCDGGPRMSYTKELMKYIKVDIYGACGDLMCGRYDSKCFELLKNDYKFYLSFENSICQDYITEKFFLNALKNNVVPIVMGASKSEYIRSAPSNSFIHVDDFNSVKQLADYLYYLDNNKTAYNEYFKWHNHGTFDFNTYTDCRLCMLAHEIDNLEQPYWYKDVNQWRANSCENRKYPII
ncbi:unnamed protein product [Schistosoma spindalis]|nr:unnamed protein product [Schistosoma spindale]